VINVTRVNKRNIVALVLVLSLVFASPVLAQSAPNGSGGGGTPANTSNNQLDNGSDQTTWSLNETKINQQLNNNSSSSQSPPPTNASTGANQNQNNKDVVNNEAKNGSYTYSPIPGYKIDFGEVITTINNFLLDQLGKGVKELVNDFNAYFLTLPAPGQPTEPSTWMTDTGIWWSAVYSIYGIMSALAIALLLPPLMSTTDTINRYERAEGIWAIAKTFAAVIFGIPITAFCLHLGNSVTMAMAPSGIEFVSSLAGVSKLGLGIVLGTVLIATKVTVVVVGVGIVMIQFLLVYLAVAFWPVFCGFRMQPTSTVRSFGNMGLSVFFLLILVKFAQVSILRFLFEITANNELQVIYALVMTTIGLLVALIGVPYIAVKKLLPTSAMIMARRGKRELRELRKIRGGGGNSGDDRSVEELTQAIEDLRNKINEK
jgi:hypothetical protein